jgi:hypothetical protein
VVEVIVDPTLAATVTIDVRGHEEIVAAMRAEFAAIVRDFASREAGLVGERLRQIAGVFERVG